MAGIPDPTTPTVNVRGGGNAVYTTVVATTAAKTDTVALSQDGTVNKYYATLTLASALNVAIGSKINIAGVLPNGYQGTDKIVTGVSDVYPYSVSYEVLTALGAQTQAGSVTVAGTYFNTGDYGTVGAKVNPLTGRSEANVKSFYQAQAGASLVNQRNNLFAGLDPNLPFPVALLKAFGETLVQGAITTVTTVVEVLTVVGTWIEKAIDAAGKIVGDIATAIVDGAGNLVEDFLDVLHWVFTGGPIEEFQKLLTGHKTLDDVKDKAVELKTSVYQTEVESGTTTDFFNTVRVLPTWVGGKTDDVNLPHSFISGTSTTVATSPSILGLDGRLVLIPVVAGQNRTWSAVKFGVAEMALNAKVPGTQTIAGTMTSASTTTLPVVPPATVGLKQATLGLPYPSYVDVGDSITVSGFGTGYTGYNGTWTVSAKSDVVPYSVSYVVPALLTTATPAILSGATVVLPAAVLMGVYDVNETTGAATKVIDLGNVRSKINVGANSQRNLQTISLPSPKLVQMGEIYYIGILQIGTSPQLALSSAPTSVIPYTFNTGTFPKRVCLYYNAGTLGVLPATFTDAQTSGSSSNFWGAFGDDVPNVIQPSVAFADSFTGTDGAVIDTQKWLARYGNGLRIASNNGQLRATANSTNGTSINTYKFKTNYLKQTAQCTINTQTENLGRLGVGGSIITLRGDGTGKFIYLRVVIELYGFPIATWRLKVGIYTSLTYSQPGTQLSGGTLRKEVLIGTNLNPSNGNTWKFIADGYTYVGYRDGVEVIRWEDTGFAFAGSGVGNANFKEVGIGAFYVSEYSCVDNWTAFDQSA
jgi:hypothetical protein